jgi:soluble lytic murein transglycosylase-like protein
MQAARPGRKLVFSFGRCTMSDAQPSIRTGRFAPVAAAIAAAAFIGQASAPNRGASAPRLAIELASAAAATSPPVPEAEAGALKAALQAVRSCDLGLARSDAAGLADPVARKIVDWALVDGMADQMSPPELQSAAARLDGWPRADARGRALERAELGGRGGSVRCGAPAPMEDAAAEAFRERRLRMYAALRRRDPRDAYDAIAANGQPPGSVQYAEGEALAGWLALDKLHDPARANMHFAKLDAAVTSPVSKARAAFWRGRVAERNGDAARAQSFYEQGAAYPTTFYGQLAAQKAGRREIVLAPDPQPTAEDRASFEGAEMTRAIRLLAAARERGLLRVFALYDGEQIRTPGELALLVDELRALDEQEVSLLAYRRGAQHGLILHERGYPLVRTANASGGAETAWMLAIMRQESQFDPRVRSPAGARGIMQIMPATGRRMAREAGMGWSDDLLWNPQANMRLGSRYLGELREAFEGSYPLIAAAYNAGPHRPPEWVEICGDPRSPGTDPLDFIECIPLGETRDYVMNVLANYQVYRARLNGGRATLTASETLRAVR